MKEQSQDQFKNNALEKLGTLSHREQDLSRRILQEKHVARNINREFDETLTFG
jgi:hypothetical protein